MNPIYTQTDTSAGLQHEMNLHSSIEMLTKELSPYFRSIFLHMAFVNAENAELLRNS